MTNTNPISVKAMTYIHFSQIQEYWTERQGSLRLQRTTGQQRHQENANLTFAIFIYHALTMRFHILNREALTESVKVYGLV